MAATDFHDVTSGSNGGFSAQAGYDLPRYQGNAFWTIPIPATFVLDARGVIVARHLDPDYRKRMEVDELVAAIKAACFKSESPRDLDLKQ